MTPRAGGTGIRGDGSRRRGLGDPDRAAVSESPLDRTIDRIARPFLDQRGMLLPLLHAVQAELGCIPDAAVPRIAAIVNLSRAEVHGVVTFYHDFRRSPAGRHSLKLCRAEACQARGGRLIERAAMERLGVSFGETRPDGLVTLEAIYCLGLCATGPNALVDGAPVSRIDEAHLDRIVGRMLS